ncbi:hypothetical protein QFC22_000955 [Naganishia vaughanmartiniae]|uniref:Uncharacterized protein n=1 Tax=Naganishia vaughanmartiniae TaxID=1424756 RepID=A0ACC2XKK0_9TREE|nr:hypothetical protein QFC22_000955 [Naganishia vaughanmartiniae]
MAHKVSPITLLTSISHERLQVYHQWGARIMLFFATVHTIPFILQPLRDWNTLRSTAYAGSFMSYFYNWTGIGAYVPLFWLVFTSFTSIRNRCYEFWVVQHVASAILFLGFMYHHTQAWLYSWNYLYATTAVWFVSCLARGVFTWTSTGLKPVKAEAEVLAGGLVKLDIPTRSSWLPGAHVFVRFPTINIIQCHPFTVANIPKKLENGQSAHTLSLLISPRAGITQSALAKANISGGRVPVMLDGPYGGIHNSLSRHDRILLIAGGVGITFIIPQLCSLLENPRHVRRVDLTWAVPSIDRIECLSPLFEVLRSHGDVPFALTINIYVTRANASSNCSSSTLDEKIAAQDEKAKAEDDLEALARGLPALTHHSSQTTCEEKRNDQVSACDTVPLYTVHEGRPGISTIVRSLESDADGQSVAVTGMSNLYSPQTDLENLHSHSHFACVSVCGPGELSVRAGNACAMLQLGILQGRKGPSEVVLHSEAFTW